MQVTIKFKNKELKNILDTMIVIVDTREKSNEHILNYFKKKNVSYKIQKLDFGDYSCMIPANPSYGIMKDICLCNNIVIERKSALRELSTNLTKERVRIESEFTRAKGKVMLLIEDASYEDVINHNYPTGYNPKAFLASLKTFEARYNLQINFITRACAGNFIYFTLNYHAREYLKS